MKDTAIKCENLAIGYNRNEPVCKDINIEIGMGDYVCVVGENGAGKSTLIKTMLGLLPPLNGSITVKKGLDIGYLPQQSMTQRSFPTSVYEVILSGNQNKAGLFYQKEHIKRADTVIQNIAIKDLKRRNYAELSGGQQQKVLLARALCASSNLLILDEPITGLDIKTQEYFYRLMETYNRDGTTIIMISHDKSVLDEHATHILLVDNNRISLLSQADYLIQRRKLYV